MRHVLLSALFVVTWVAWTTSASSKAFNYTNENDAVAPTLRVDLDEEREEERGAPVSSVDDAVVQLFNKLPKDQQENLMRLVNEHVQVAHIVNDPKAKFQDVQPPEKAIPMLKAWFKETKAEDRDKLSSAQKLKAAGVVGEQVPDDALNAFMALGKTMKEHDQTRWKTFLTFMKFVGAVTLGVLIMAIYYSYHGSTTTGMTRGTTTSAS